MNRFWVFFLALGIPAAAAPGSPAATTLAAGDVFTLAIMPDTQQETSGTRFANRLQWIVNNRATRNIPFVLHSGDMMNFNLDSQYAFMSEGLKILDNAAMPYATCIGNHDTAAVRSDSGSAAPGDVHANLRNTAKYNTYFPATRFRNVRGFYESGKIDNAWHTFSAGGLDWLVVNLELWPRTGAVSWAKTVVAGHPNHNVIILTHSYLTSGGGIEQTNGGYGDNSPQYLFDNLVKLYANVRLVFCGHVGTHAHRTDKGVNGNTIYSFLQCYHDNTTNPTRLLQIDTANGTLKSSVYCPSTNQYKNDGSTFTITGVRWVQPAASTPAAPSGLKATASSPSQIGLVWTDNASNETGFKIERKTGASGTWAPIATVGANVTTYQDVGLADSTAFVYRVRASNAYGDSSYSNEAGAATHAPPGGPGLAGAYYDNADFTGLMLSRNDAQVNFEWGAGSPDPRIGADSFSVRWTGRIRAEYAELTTFYVRADDGVRLWVNGELLVDAWRDQSAAELGGSLALAAGRWYSIQLDYYENGGQAVAQLSWSGPSIPKQVIPQDRFSPETAAVDGRDNDGDGVPNDRDPDDDGDGIPDLQDGDRDGDGWSNVMEEALGADADDGVSVPGEDAEDPWYRRRCGALGGEALLALGLLRLFGGGRYRRAGR